MQQRPRTLAFTGIGLGLASLLMFAVSRSFAIDGDLMTIGLVVLGLLGAGLLGLAGTIVSVTALRRSEVNGDRALAIAGLALCAGPTLLLVLLGIFLGANRPELPEQPLEPPPELLSPAADAASGP